MAELSPAAQAVFDAYLNAPCGKPRQSWVAAALRAAADYDPPYDPDAGYDMGWYAGMEFIQTIAAELEGTQ